MGLQRQVLLNGVKIAMAVLGSGGGVMILWLVSPTITAFLGWQIAAGALQVLILAACLWGTLPSGGRGPRFAPALLRNVWRFAAGMSGITVSALILTQLDKVILSKFLPLKMFGYYTLATAVSNGLYVLITPVFNATFPKLSAMVASRDENGVRELYHIGTQMMAVLILPVALVTAFFSHEIMALWTGSTETARNTAPVLTILIIGTAMNGLMNIPYALQLAHGWTKLGFLITVGLILTMAPSMYATALLFGPIGVAVVWAVVNFVYLTIGVHLTHRRVLVGEARRWYLVDVALPLAASVLLSGTARGVLDIDPSQRFLSAATLCGLFLAVVSAAAFVSPILRKWMGDQWKEWKGQYA